MEMRGKGVRWTLAVVALAVMVLLGRFAFVRGTSDSKTSSDSGPGPAGKVAVDVIYPRSGGIERICTQPGSVEPFESADIYTKVSGFLAEQNVDIGYKVKQGDILARIAVPELEKQVQQDKADVVRAEARVDQMKSAIATAQADVGAATAAIALADAEALSKVSYRAFREKQRDRMKDLSARMAIDVKLAEESEDQFQAAISAESAAKQAIVAARQKENAAKARVEQARADLRFAEADVLSAKAHLERSQVFLDYTVIRSPYTGVVTKRTFHRGDFIRAADSGGDHVFPLFAIERTDRMRIVVQVPERDVPYVDPGDPAIVEVDALPGVKYCTRGDEKVGVSLLADSEDPHSRMMRTEVHVNNADGKLRRGMFGRVTLILEPGAAGACRIPSTALAGKGADGKASVRVVRDGKIRSVSVTCGADNGSEVEILSGLTTDDRVVVRAMSAVHDGDEVSASEGSFPAK
jgi:HlyD family secretion protein